MEPLQPATWRPRARAHQERVDTLVAAHLARREAGIEHPVHDFLFTYYSHRPAHLRRWHPGSAFALAGGESYDGIKGYLVADGVARVDPAYVVAQRPLVSSLHRLLIATAGRAPHFGCFGLHEWAMVHGSARVGTRHDWPLRLGAAGTDEVVESHRIGCSHFDAFRFFTDSARPLNTLQPGRDDRAEFEQPACLHGSMDLYKHAFRLSPMVSSSLVLDCFELAWDVRVLDMRAAPYDLTGVRFDHSGEAWTPVRIETPSGKAEYAAAQRVFAERAAPLRERLIEECERLLGE